MASLEMSDPAVALRQLIILARGVPIATKVIVIGNGLTPKDAPALLLKWKRIAENAANQ